MNPAILAAILKLVELGIAEEPQIALELHNIFSKPNPTPADFQAARDRVLGESFESLAPAAAANLPTEVVAAPAQAQGDQAQAPAVAPAVFLHPIYGTPVN